MRSNWLWVIQIGVKALTCTRVEIVTIATAGHTSRLASPFGSKWWYCRVPSWKLRRFDRSTTAILIMYKEPSLADEVIMVQIDGEVVDRFLAWERGDRHHPAPQLPWTVCNRSPTRILPASSHRSFGRFPRRTQKG
jgi:hypothetical protein